MMDYNLKYDAGRSGGSDYSAGTGMGNSSYKVMEAVKPHPDKCGGGCRVCTNRCKL